MLRAICLVISVLAACGAARADVPAGLTYQGLLTGAAGDPLGGTVNLVVSMWRDPVSTQIPDLVYQENHLAVPVTDGVFSISLGRGTLGSGPFDASLFAQPDRWLEVAVNGETLAPRQRLESVAYSFQAGQCMNAATLAGQSVSSIVSQAQTGLSFAIVGGQIADSQVPAGIARDAEILPAVLSADGPGSQLDADLLDGLSSASFTQLGQSIEGPEISDATITGSDIATGAISSAQILNATIADADVSSSAAIQGTKIDPNFGSQNIFTTGSIGSPLSAAPLDLLIGGARAFRIDGTATPLIPNLLGGSFANTTATGNIGATIAGGGNAGSPNQTHDTYTTVGGGLANVAGLAGGTPVDGTSATVAGGVGNTASGSYSAIPGGENNTAAGAYSLAAGRRARANHMGAFVFADSTNADFASSGPNQLLIRASGGVGIGGAPAPVALHLLTPGAPPGALPVAQNGLLLGIESTGGYKWMQSYGGVLALNPAGNAVVIGETAPLTGALFEVNGDAAKPLGGSWAVLSDLRAKRDLRPIDAALERMLALRGVSFEYSDPAAVHQPPGRHLGFVAQEAEQVFPDWVSTRTDGLKSLSIHGFEALTVEAVRELEGRVAERDARIAALEARLALLEARLRD